MQSAVVVIILATVSPLEVAVGGLRGRRRPRQRVNAWIGLRIHDLLLLQWSVVFRVHSLNGRGGVLAPQEVACWEGSGLVQRQLEEEARAAAFAFRGEPHPTLRTRIQ